MRRRGLSGCGSVVRCWLLASVCSQVVPAQAQVTSQWLELPRQALRFGDRVALAIHVELAADWQLLPPSAAEFRPWLARLESAPRELLPAGATRHTLRYEVLLSDLQGPTAGSLPLGLLGPDGQRSKLPVELPPLAIASLLPEPPGGLEWDLAPLPWQQATRSWWAWLLLLLALATAGAVCWRRRREAAPLAMAAAPRPAVELALAALDRLQWDGCLDRASALRFADGVVEVLRKFLTAQAGFAAAAKTSEEWLQLCSVSGPALAACLKPLDLVRFAAVQPEPQDLRAALAAAREFLIAMAAAGGGR